MGDLISREAAIDALNDEFTIIGKTNAIVVQDYIRRVNNRLHDLPSAEQWIPVSERLPEEGVQVLVTDDAGGLATIDVDCGYFDEEYGRFEWFHSQNVTAWMPLPEPYKEKNESQRLQV